MAIPGRLSKPPIKEALVDIRVEQNNAVDSKSFEPIWKTIQSRYPRLEVRNRYTGRLTPRAGAAPELEGKDLGFYGLFVRTSDESMVAQFRTDGFTISQLANYTTADVLFTEALSLWQIYVAAAKPVSVARVALRYINELKLPLEHGDSFDGFLSAAPTMPLGSPQLIAEFLTRTVVPIDPATGTTAIIAQRLQPRSDQQEAVIVIDLDVFRPGKFDLSAETLAPILQELRLLKDDLFFALVTDEALEPYR